MSVTLLDERTRLELELLSLIEKAISIVEYQDETIAMYHPWDEIYDQIFSKEISDRISTLQNELNIHFDYCDPDTTYEEDVRAYTDALARLAEDMLGEKD